jgi:hypothetical protein
LLQRELCAQLCRDALPRRGLGIPARERPRPAGTETGWNARVIGSPWAQLTSERQRF